MSQDRIFKMPFASVYPHYIAKAEKKGRSKEEVDALISWLTGYDTRALRDHLDNKTDFETFFAHANIHPNASMIKGLICGHRVEDIADPLMQKIRYLDKLIDELAKGKSLDKIFRK